MIQVVFISYNLHTYNLHTFFLITGHCVTPVAYHYDPETTRLIMKEFNSDNMKKFLKEYTSYSSHQIGTSESHLFANNISELWSQFGLSKVELSQVKNVIPQPDPKMPSKITIFDEKGERVFSLDIKQEQDLVSFTPQGIEKGQLVYGHYGRFEDLTSLQRYSKYFRAYCWILKLI